MYIILISWSFFWLFTHCSAQTQITRPLGFLLTLYTISDYLWRILVVPQIINDRALSFSSPQKNTCCTRFTNYMLIPWGGCYLWFNHCEVLEACGLWSMEAWVRSIDHIVTVGNMFMCDHDVESTQEGCLSECCSDVRWPGLFDEVRRASWRIYLSICK